MNRAEGEIEKGTCNRCSMSQSNHAQRFRSLNTQGRDITCAWSFISDFSTNLLYMFSRDPLRAIQIVAIRRRSCNLERLVDTNFYFSWKWRMLYCQAILTTGGAGWPGPWPFQVSLAFDVRHHNSQFIRSQLAPVSSIHWSQRHRSLPTSIIAPVRPFGEPSRIWWIYVRSEPFA